MKPHYGNLSNLTQHYQDLPIIKGICAMYKAQNQASSQPPDEVIRWLPGEAASSCCPYLPVATLNHPYPTLPGLTLCCPGFQYSTKYKRQR